MNHIDKFFKPINTGAATINPSAAEKSAAKRRKFNVDWTELFLFTEVKEKAQCLLCTFTASEVHASKIKRHFESVHGDVNRNYPEGSEKRKAYVASLQNQMLSQQQAIRQVVNSSDAIMLAGLRVCWRIARQKKSFSDAPMVKECIVDVVKILSQGTYQTDAHICI